MPLDEVDERGDARAALDKLKHRSHRSAVALLVYEPTTVPDWNAVALVHSLGQCDYVELLISQVNPETRFLNLDADTERDRLSHLAEMPNAHSCVLVIEFDVAVARLNFAERVRLWNNLLFHFPYRNTALLITMPRGASHLLPDPDALTLWIDAGKVILLPDLEKEAHS